MAFDQIIEEIKQRIDLVSYIGRFVNLKPAGRTYKALCPFHTEKTPSFFVFPDTNSWHCFGACSEGGDIFSFVQKHERLTFREALQLLAFESGLRLEEESEEQQQARIVIERLLSCCEAAASEFQQWLIQRPDAQDCRDYIKLRAFSGETIHRFGLGYAPNSWDNLLFVMTERGYHPQDLVEIGLARQGERGGYYDALRNRLVFPIRNMRGHIVGFGGRIIYTDDDRPKYINSPQSAIFDKSSTLYGLDIAKEGIRQANRSVIVEGYIDVITAHQAGFTNVVASLGTALTEKQLRLLTRYSPNVTFALDADYAGEKAAERGLYRILALQKQARQQLTKRTQAFLPKISEMEGDIRVLMLPKGYDPDQLIREDPKRWEELVRHAMPVVDYLMKQRIQKADLSDPIEKARVAADLLPLIAELESTLVRLHYIQGLARLLQIDERSLSKEMNKYVEKQTSKQSSLFQSDTTHPSHELESTRTEPAGEMEVTSFISDDDRLLIIPDKTAQIKSKKDSTKATLQWVYDLESYLLYLMLQHPILVTEALDIGLRPDMWQKTEHREIWQALLNKPPATRAHLEEFILDLEPPIAQQVRHIDHYYASFPRLEGQAWKNEAFNKLFQFFNDYEQRKQQQIQYIIDDLQSSMGKYTVGPEMRELLQRRNMIGQNLLKRQKLLHRRMREHKA